MQAFYNYSITGLWIVWLVYWVVAAFGAKAIRRREAPTARLSHLVPMVVALILLLPRHLPLVWLTTRILPPGIL